MMQSASSGFFSSLSRTRSRRGVITASTHLNDAAAFTTSSAQGRGRFDRVHPARSALKRSRPLSRVLSKAVIPLGCASPRTSSDLPGSLHVGHTLRPRAPLASLFGLASGGVCRAADVATRAVRSYRTISPLPVSLARYVGGIFLLHFP